MEINKNFSLCFIKMQQDFMLLSSELNQYLRDALKLVVDEHPSDFGCVEWSIKTKDSKIFIKVSATGMLVADFQHKLTPEEKTSLDTSKDYLEADFQPSNMFNLKQEEQLERFIKKAKEHFNLVNA